MPAANAKLPVKQSKAPRTVTVTHEMIMDLYSEEQEKLLEEPLYAGGGLNPAYGPRVDLGEYMTLHGKMPDRDYYSFLLLDEWKRLKYPVDWQEL